MNNKKIERKTRITYGYSDYWSIIYTDGSFERIPVKTKKQRRKQ
jgi:hypothetical protein